MAASGPPSQDTVGRVAPYGRPRPAPGLAVAVLREKSCGIVPFREVDGEIRYLVISSAVTKREHWEFPKGGVEEGEREIETALRELWEETGVKDVRVLPGYREPIRYIYRRPEGLVSKQVVYFIARVADPAVTLREVEAKDYRWANYAETRKLLRHANARALLERCHAFITGRPLPVRRGPAPEATEAEAQRRRGRRRRGGGKPEAGRGAPAQQIPQRRPVPEPAPGSQPALAAANAAPGAKPPPRQGDGRPAAPAGEPARAAAGGENAAAATQRRRRRRRRGGRRQDRAGRAERADVPASGAPKETI